MGWRFAQLSDAHLGFRLAGLSETTAAALRDAMREAIVAAFKLARDKGCQAVLIPGDLFDVKGFDPHEQLRFVYEQAADYPAQRFFIAPGNSDAFNPSSPYVQVHPPSNVTLFIGDDWETHECDGVTITARAIQSGEGIVRLDWDTLPVPDPAKPSVVMLHGMMHGADDGYSKRLTIMPISPTDLLSMRFSYAALGHMHATIELRRSANRAAAAYAGPPQCLGFDERGPGGVLIGSLHQDGAELAFHSTCKYTWTKRHVDLPAPWTENYKAKLQAAYQSITDSLQTSDILQLTLAGELPAQRSEELHSVLQAAREQAFQVEVNTDGMQTYSGLDPLDIPAGSLLSEYFSRLSAEATQVGANPDVYDLARRLGWRLFTGQGLPAEITS